MHWALFHKGFGAHFSSTIYLELFLHPLCSVKQAHGFSIYVHMQISQYHSPERLFHVGAEHMILLLRMYKRGGDILQQTGQLSFHCNILQSSGEASNPRNHWH